jgi:hypothetical protein
MVADASRRPEPMLQAPDRPPDALAGARSWSSARNGALGDGRRQGLRCRRSAPGAAGSARAQAQSPLRRDRGRRGRHRRSIRWTWRAPAGRLRATGARRCEPNAAGSKAAALRRRVQGPGLAENTDPVDLLRALHVNLTAPMLLTRACLPLLASGRRCGGGVRAGRSARIGSGVLGRLWPRQAGPGRAGLGAARRNRNGPCACRACGPGRCAPPCAAAYFAETRARWRKRPLSPPACVRPAQLRRGRHPVAGCVGTRGLHA